MLSKCFVLNVASAACTVDVTKTSVTVNAQVRSIWVKVNLPKITHSMAENLQNVVNRTE